MEKFDPAQEQEQPFQPNMFWEGFYYLSFFVFFIIVLIPYAPKSITFDQYYPIAMIPFGIAGFLCGAITFRILKNTSSKVKFAVMAILYAVLIYYLLTNIQNFSV